MGRRSSSRTQRGLCFGLSLLLSGCGAVGSVKHAVLGGDDTAGQLVSGFIGGVAADEPRAALAARDMLAAGGNAADAAVALGFMLAVTLPSRASLGAGGACIAYARGAASPNKGVPEAIMFTSRAPLAAGGDRPAALPMMARGLYLLGARYGSKQVDQMIAPAEQVAKFGHPISRALARDLVEVAGPLSGDPQAAAVFAPGGVALGEGGKLVQSDLADSLAQIRTVGVGDMYQGLLAHKLAEASAQAGGPFSINDLRTALPTLENPLVIPAGNDKIAFLPPPADGGLAAAAAFQVLQHDPSAYQAASLRALSAAATWRAQGGDASAILASAGSAAGLPALPASTSFVVVDRKGGAVACALSMGNLFGTGRIAPGTGIVLAASPGAKPQPLLTAAIAWNENIGAFHAAIGASGQNGAALAGAVAMTQALSGATSPVPDPGRANQISCTNYLPSAPQSCSWSTDPRTAGLAVSGN